MPAGLQNINLMGPNPAQPFDIQTAQAQLQQQQQIAQALLASGMSPTQMLDTGQVKVANWGDALGKLAETYLGRKALDTVGGQQQQLANEVLARRQAELQGAFSPDAQGNKPKMLDVAKALLRSTDPTNYALGGQIMSQVAKGEEERQIKPDFWSSAAKAGIKIPSVPVETSDFGYSVIPSGRGKEMEVQPKLEKATPEERILSVPQPGAGPPQQATEVAPTQPMAPRVVEPGAPIPDTGVTNPNPHQVQISTRGEVGPVKGAQLSAAEETAKLKTNQAQASQEDLISRKNMIQQQASMLKIAQYAADHGGNFGSSGPIVNEIRKWAAAAGFSADETNKITDYEYFIKNAVPQAAKNAREGVGARVPVVEYQGFTKALGAGGTGDPRAMVKIMHDRMLDTVNLYQQHKDIILPSLAAAAGNPKAYQAPAFDVGKDIIEPLRQAGVPVNWQQDSTGTWMNAITPGEGPPAYPVKGKKEAPKPTKLPPGFTIEPITE